VSGRPFDLCAKFLTKAITAPNVAADKFGATAAKTGSLIPVYGLSVSGLIRASGGAQSGAVRVG